MRKASFARRAAVPAGVRRNFAERLAHAGPKLFRDPDARAIAGYWPVLEEPDCLPLLAALAQRGYDTLLPAITAPGSPLLFRRWRKGEALVRNRFGIAEPTGEGETAPNVVIVPCAAFDRSGHRIGFGKGYYDVTLAKLRAQGRVLALALAFACQEVETIPAEAHDERLDAVLTERGLLICTQTGKALDEAAVHW